MKHVKHVKSVKHMKSVKHIKHVMYIKYKKHDYQLKHVCVTDLSLRSGSKYDWKVLIQVLEG